MIYVNEHLAKRVFKFEGLSDLADMSEKGDYSLSPMTSHRGIIMCHYTPTLVALLDFNGKGRTTSTIASLSGCLLPHGCSQRSSVS